MPIISLFISTNSQGTLGLSTIQECEYSWSSQGLRFQFFTQEWIYHGSRMTVLAIGQRPGGKSRSYPPRCILKNHSWL